MSSNDPHVIVGAGLAGATAARTLREEGWTGPVVLLGDEDERPYERPPLSKGYLLGKEPREKAFTLPADWYPDHDVDLRLGTRVTDLDPTAREVVLMDGSRLRYDKVLLTTGSSPRRVPVPGATLEGVHYLRQLWQSDRLKEALAGASRVAVIGAGWIGLEVTAAAREAGADVTVLHRSALPLGGVLGPEAAQVFADLHRDHGVDLRTGVEVAEITGSSGVADGVRLADGTHVPADVVVVGVGAEPNTWLAEAAGLEVDNGVLTDASLLTSAPHVYAAGDIANAYHPLFRRRLRVEHWANALNQPQTAAKAMLGQDVAYDRLPYFFSDQYDLGMEYSGFVEPGGYDRVVFRGDVAAREFVAFWLSEGRVLAGMNVNVWDVNEHVQQLVRSGATVDTGALADPSVPLESLV